MSPKKHLENLIAAIEVERQHEEKYYRQLSEDKSPKEKIEAGILWYRVELLKAYYTIGEYVEIQVERTRQRDLSHKFKVGAGCFVVIENEQKESYRAVVSQLRRNTMRVMLQTDILSRNKQQLEGNLSIELSFDERSYKVMKKSIQRVIENKDRDFQFLRNGILGDETFSYERKLKLEEYYFDKDLNQSQKEAVINCLKADKISIIHGPPGTGKTTTLVALVQNLLKKEKRVFVAAPSNNAVDLLCEKLAAKGVRVVRVGNITRISTAIAKLSLAEQARKHPEWSHIKKVKIEAEEAKRLAGSSKRRFGEKERSDRKMMYREAKELRKWARDLEDKLIENILMDAQVIASTLIGLSHSSLNGIEAETVVIDEASQALEPECWNAMLKTKRVVLAGDHLQLAPTIKSNEAKEMGLGNTMLNQLTDRIKFSSLLNIQYRMNDEILGFSNNKFYNNQLISDVSVATQRCKNDSNPLVFIDTSGCDFNEEMNAEHRSIFNKGEYFILREHLLKHAENQAGFNIGIISPYAEQVRYIRREIEADEELKIMPIQVNSIDGFQGQEKDIIYISLARSNDKGYIGFLSDERRLNVAMTRAKKKLVIIGDMSTLSQHELFSDLADHIDAHGLYSSAWEYMG